MSENERRAADLAKRFPVGSRVRLIKDREIGNGFSKVPSGTLGTVVSISAELGTLGVRPDVDFAFLAEWSFVVEFDFGEQYDDDKIDECLAAETFAVFVDGERIDARVSDFEVETNVDRCPTCGAETFFDESSDDGECLGCTIKRYGHVLAPCLDCGCGVQCTDAAQINGAVCTGCAGVVQ